jgi:hypothetical protein
MSMDMTSITIIGISLGKFIVIWNLFNRYLANSILFCKNNKCKAISDNINKASIFILFALGFVPNTLIIQRLCLLFFKG